MRAISDYIFWIVIVLAAGVVVAWWQLGLTTTADVAALLSLATTIWVLYNLSRIERAYLFQASAPDQLKRLESHRSRLNNLLNNYENSTRQIAEELSSCLGILIPLRRNVRGIDPKLEESLEELVQEIEECPSPPNSERRRDVDNVYYKLVTVSDQLREAILERKRKQ